MVDMFTPVESSACDFSRLQEDGLPERIVVVRGKLVMVSYTVFEGIERDEGFGFWDIIFCADIRFLVYL